MATKLLMLTGGPKDGASWAGSQTIASALEELGPVSVTVTGDPAAFTKLRGYDAVLIRATGGKLNRGQEQGLVSFVRGGGGLVGLAGANEAFVGSRAYQALIGSRGGPVGPLAELRVVPVDELDPLMARMGDVRVADQLSAPRLTAKDVQVHATVAWHGKRVPAVYSRTVGKGRVIYTVLGRDPGVGAEPGAAKLLWRAVAFATQRLDPGPVRVVVVGYGASSDRGRIHAETIRSTPGLALRGVCDIDPARLEAAGDDLGSVRAYPTIKAVAADREVDLAVVTTPNATHGPLGLALLQGGKHVVCETPLALTTKECGDMIRLAQRKRLLLSCFQGRRWDGDFQAARRVIASGAIGDVYHVELGMGSFSHPGHWWRTDRRAAGSVLHEWGTHLIDWALSLVPGPITEIAGFFQKNVWHDVTIEDWASVVLRFEGGRTAMIELGHGVGAPRPKWRILGSRGSVWGDWGLEHLTVMAYQDGRLLTTRVPVDEAAGDSFYVDLADTLLTGSRPGATAADAARVVEVLEVAQRSGRAGKAQAVGL